MPGFRYTMALLGENVRFFFTHPVVEENKSGYFRLSKKNHKIHRFMFGNKMTYTS